MRSNLWEYDLTTLKSMYEEEKESLTNALLNGVSWDSLRDQRRNVTELAIVIHKNASNSGNPAENQTRSDSGKS